MTRELRSYQLLAKLAFFAAVEAGLNRALIVMATGLGKTYTAAEITEEWRSRFGGRALFVVHQVGIAEQARTEFQQHLTDDVMCGLLTGDRDEHVYDCDVLFTTFQSMHADARDSFSSDHFNFIIVDEAHHISAETYRPVISHFNGATVLSLTATPDRSDGQDIRDITGNEIFTYTLAQGIAEGYLARMDYRVECDNIDTAKLQELVDRVTGGDRTVSISDIDSTIILRERLEAIEKKVREVESEFGRRLKKIIFCRSINHIKEVNKDFPDAAPYHSKMSHKKREEVLTAFRKGELSEILVRDMFNEGIDIPDAEMLVFLRATETETIWLQQLGRGLRLSEGKAHLVVLDFVANCDRIRRVATLRDDIVQVTKPTSNEESEDKERIVINDSGWSFTFTEEIRDVLNILRCVDGLPEADQDGFIEAEGEKWATTAAIARIFDSHPHAISKCIESCRHRVGTDSGKRARIFYALSDALEACTKRFIEHPRAGTDGTFEVDGVVWAPINVLTKRFNLTPAAIERRVMDVARSRPGRTRQNQMTIFYALSDALEACTDLLTATSSSREDGTFEEDGETWIIHSSFIERYKLPYEVVKKRLESCRKKSGRDRGGGKLACFYALSDALEACTDLLQPCSRPDKGGTLEEDGETWLISSAICRRFSLSRATVFRQLKSRGHECRQRQVRDASGHLCAAYALLDVEKIFTDLLVEYPKAGADGTFEADGETWGTDRSLGRLLGVSAPTIRRRRINCRERLGKDSGGRIQTFVALSDIRKACEDLLKSN